MAKFYGKIGFIETVESPADSGVYVERATERNYFGDVLRNSRRWQTASDQKNDNLTIDNEISIVADPYALQNFHSMRYIEWMGTLWKISNVTVEYPRLTLSIGGEYNGTQT